MAVALMVGGLIMLMLEYESAQLQVFFTNIILNKLHFKVWPPVAGVWLGIVRLISCFSCCDNKRFAFMKVKWISVFREDGLFSIASLPKGPLLQCVQHYTIQYAKIQIVKVQLGNSHGRLIPK